MNITMITRVNARAAPEKDTPVKIVGVYSDLFSQTLGVAVFHRIARKCSRLCQLHSDWWSFDTLEAAPQREAAACAAATADMIWWATNACESLPEGVRAWADLWSGRREREGALVALLRCPSDYAIEQSPSWAYVCWLAREARTVLFAQRFECDCRRLARPPGVPLLVSGWHPVQSEPEPHPLQWGINE